MRILLIRPNWGTHQQINPPLGLMYISAAAKNAGHECQIKDAWLNNMTARQSAFALIPHVEFDILGLQVYQNTVQWVKEFIFELRKYSKAKFIIGGPYATVVGEQARIETGADVAIKGEFDNTLRDHLSMIVINFKGVIKTERTDVNAIPIPDYDSINLPDYWPFMHAASSPSRGDRFGLIQSTRGCSSHCTFCSAGATMGHTVRYRNIENIIEEVEYLKSRYDVNEIWFSDDNMIVNYNRGIELFARLEPFKLHIRLPMGVRYENVNAQMARQMKRAGVYFTGIGIESGNPRVLKRIKKNINQEGLKKAIELLDSFGIITMGFFILGLPTETHTEMQETVQWSLKTKLKGAQFGIFIPYPGSEDANEKSLLPHEELAKLQISATLRFYLRPRIIWSFIKNLKMSQVKALWVHPWIKAWIGERL